MNKTTLFFVMLMLCSMASLAQSGEKNAFFIGVKGGATLSSMTQPNEGKLYDAYDIGYSGGIAMKMRFGTATENTIIGGTGYIGLGLEVKYVQNKIKTFGTDDSGKKNAPLKLGYFSAPVSLQVYPFAHSSGMNTFYMEFGGAVMGLMTRDPKNLSVSKTESGNENITYHIDDESEKLKGICVKPFAGLGYTVKCPANKPGGFDINVRYYFGLNKLSNNFSSKISNLEVSLGWMFDVCEF